MYSEILCRKLRGSLKAMGMVILDSSYGRQQSINSSAHDATMSEDMTETREFRNPADIKGAVGKS